MINNTGYGARDTGHETKNKVNPLHNVIITNLLVGDYVRSSYPEHRNDQRSPFPVSRTPRY